MGSLLLVELPRYDLEYIAAATPLYHILDLLALYQKQRENPQEFQMQLRQDDIVHFSAKPATPQTMLLHPDPFCESH